MTPPPVSGAAASTPPRGLVGVFASHPIACNLLMVMMLLAGGWALTRLNTQFLPTFDVVFITIDVKWTGASAEDVAAAITEPIERELLGLDAVREMTSASSRGSAQIVLEFEGRPAVSLQLRRSVTTDSLGSARIVHEWLDERRGGWPPGVEVVAWDESWELIRDRTMLLLENGVGGLILVVAVLFLFLDARVASWVAAGILVSFMAALGVLWARDRCPRSPHGTGSSGRSGGARTIRRRPWATWAGVPGSRSH